MGVRYKNKSRCFLVNIPCILKCGVTCFFAYFSFAYGFVVCSRISELLK